MCVCPASKERVIPMHGTDDIYIEQFVCCASGWSSGDDAPQFCHVRAIYSHPHLGESHSAWAPHRWLSSLRQMLCNIFLDHSMRRGWNLDIRGTESEHPSQQKTTCNRVDAVLLRGLIKQHWKRYHNLGHEQISCRFFVARTSGSLLPFPPVQCWIPWPPDDFPNLVFHTSTLYWGKGGDASATLHHWTSSRAGSTAPVGPVTPWCCLISSVNRIDDQKARKIIQLNLI